MEEEDELAIKRSKLEMRLGGFKTLKDFDDYITQQMKDDIDLKIEEEKQERANSKVEQDKKINELESIKYK